MPGLTIQDYHHYGKLRPIVLLSKLFTVVLNLILFDSFHYIYIESWIF